MEKERTKFNAEAEIRKSLAPGAAIGGVIAERFYPKKTVRAIKRQASTRVAKIVVK